MVLNDALDAQIDRRERPRRPIPSGRVSRRWAFGLAVTSAALGLLVALPLGRAAFASAVALAACAALYNLTHARFAASIVLLGVCRALVYVLAALAVAPQGLWRSDLFVPLAAAVYTMLFSIVARGEAGPLRHSPWTRWSAVTLALAPLLAWPAGAFSWIAGAALFVVACWVARVLTALLQHRPQLAVTRAIAGLCLVDAWFLTLLGPTPWLLAPYACFAATRLAQRRLAGS
jgi:4-hydroxybenzoate polyprenyltransferase